MGKFVLKQTKSNGYFFDLVASNGQVVANGQNYKTLSGCKGGIESVKANAGIALVEDQTVKGFKVEKNPKFEVYADKRGEVRFRLKARNGQIIAVGEGYTSKESCLKGIDSIKKNIQSAKIEKE